MAYLGGCTRDTRTKECATKQVGFFRPHYKQSMSLTNSCSFVLYYAAESVTDVTVRRMIWARERIMTDAEACGESQQQHPLPTRLLSKRIIGDSRFAYQGSLFGLKSL